MSEPARPVKTEQLRADRPAHEVAPGIFRVMLPIDLPGLGHVNCYAIPDDRGLTLVDPGLADGVSHDALAAQLTLVDLDIGLVHTVVTTHSHFDHYGGLARLRAIKTDVPIESVAHRTFGEGWRAAYDEVLQGEDSSALIVRSDVEVAELSARLVRPTPWGTQTEPFPHERLITWGEGIDVVDILRPPHITKPLDDGDTLMMGGIPWTALHTPGHADDHLCLWNAETGVLFGGDHLLPTITPHISGMSSYEDPLQMFFESLERVGGLAGATIVLPAHGDPFTDLSGRAADIHEHHLGRLDRVADIGQEIGTQPVDAYMRLLFRERSWGSMAASETYAHLEWLRVHRGARRDDRDGAPTYSV